MLHLASVEAVGLRVGERRTVWRSFNEAKTEMFVAPEWMSASRDRRYVPEHLMLGLYKEPVGEDLLKAFGQQVGDMSRVHHCESAKVRGSSLASRRSRGTVESRKEVLLEGSPHKGRETQTLDLRTRVNPDASALR